MYAKTDTIDSNKRRYPTQYVKKPLKQEFDSGSDDSSDDNDNDNDNNNNNDNNENAEPDNFITKNHVEIMELCTNKQIDKLKDLIDNFMNGSIYPISWYLKHTPDEYCIGAIAKDCIKNNNLELFTTIVQQHNMYFNCHIIYYDVIRAIKEHNNPIHFLNILIDNNVEIKCDRIVKAIETNNVNFIDCLGLINYCLKNAWDEYLSELNKEKIDTNLLQIPMIKVLMNHKIDISLNLTDLILAAIEQNKLDVIEFLVESFSSKIEININQYLDKCCEENNSDALIYFLKKGANINSINKDVLLQTYIDIIKVLIDVNYPVPEKTLKAVLMYNYVFDDDMNFNNINYLLKNGAQIQWIFDTENRGASRKRSFLICKDKKIHSYLEHVIVKGQIEKIKFLVDADLNQIIPMLDRLFVIACANGQNDIASYLFELGAKLNDKAMISACYFGHYETVIMLLQLGMAFSSTSSLTRVNNLFKITYMGTNGCCFSYSEIYDDLIEDNIIFRNDLYCGGDKHLEIVKLLISYNYPTFGETIFFPYSQTFYDVEIFSYFIQNGYDINKKWESPMIKANGKRENDSRNLLEGAIIMHIEDYTFGDDHDGLAIIEFLLQSGIDTVLTNKYAIRIVNESQYTEFQKLMMMYGVHI